jgi:hypothetical protein
MSSPTSEYLNKHTLRRVQVLDCIIHRREKNSSTISKNSDLDVSGYVYAATNDLFPSLVKIGCTLDEDPIIRLNFIATKIELASSFKIIAIIKTKDPYKLKAQMHGYFHTYKYPGENGIEFFEVPIISVQRYFSDYIRDRNSKNDKGVKTQNLIVKQNYFQHNDGDMRIDNSNNIPIIKSIVDNWIDSIIEDAVVKFSVDKVIPIKKSHLAIRKHYYYNSLMMIPQIPKKKKLILLVLAIKTTKRLLLPTQLFQIFLPLIQTPILKKNVFKLLLLPTQLFQIFLPLIQTSILKKNIVNVIIVYPKN